MFITNFVREFFSKFKDKQFKPYPVKLSKFAPESLKKSFKIRCVDAGDDEWLMAELYALEGPNYSLDYYGIGFTASPKHADAILVAGAVSKNMENALKSAYDLTPWPKVLIACGDSAIGWDRFGAKSAKEILWIKPDLEIPWNPPSAMDILSYLVWFVKWK